MVCGFGYELYVEIAGPERRRRLLRGVSFGNVLWGVCVCVCVCAGVY